MLFGELSKSELEKIKNWQLPNDPPETKTVLKKGERISKCLRGLRELGA